MAVLRRARLRHLAKPAPLERRPRTQADGNLQEAVPLTELAQVSSANSRAALARIVEEDPEEDLAAAAVAEVEAVAVMALDTMSMSSTARPGTTADHGGEDAAGH